MKISNIASILALTALCACSQGNKWHLKGQISGVEPGTEVVLEATNQGGWYPVDTLTLERDGRFSYSHAAQAYPDIYRLRIGNAALCFPVDSIETLTLTASGPDFERTFTLDGTPGARTLHQVDSTLTAMTAELGAATVVNDSALKRRLGQMILADPSGITAYYVVNKRVGGLPLFNPRSKADVRLIGAVANAYTENRPTDPRTKYLRRLYMENRQLQPGERPIEDLLTANEVRAFDISLYDRTGTKHSLLEETAKGVPVLLCFTVYESDFSPALNVALNSVYEKYHGRGLEIFQVAFDEDEYFWKQSARNLPWISVYNSPADGTKALSDYNVGSLPAIFVFDRKGDVVERVTDISTLDSSVARVI